jgi:hypothetical protein
MLGREKEQKSQINKNSGRDIFLIPSVFVFYLKKREKKMPERRS